MDKKTILLLVPFLVVLTLGQAHSADTVIYANISCGDGACSIGENSNNCPLDCSNLFADINTDLYNPYIRSGERRSFVLDVRNMLNSSIVVDISVDGEISQILNMSDRTIQLGPRETRRVNMLAYAEKNASSVYGGKLVLSSGGKETKIPVVINIIANDDTAPRITLSVLSKSIDTDGSLIFYQKILYAGELNLTLSYLLRDKHNNTIDLTHDTVRISDTDTRIKNITVDGLNVSAAEYILEVTASYGNRAVGASDTFTIVQPFWTPVKVRLVIFAGSLLVLAGLAYIGVKKYNERQMKNRRYLLPSYSLIPAQSETSFRIGKIAETNKPAWYDPNDLTTHVLTAGSTGSGKSVSASIFVEEALLHKIPIVVFDPTSQWTGFLKPCSDQNLLRYYKEFGMDPTNDARPFRGLIYNVETPDVNIEFKKYMNPGEITIFNLSFLKPGEYDQAVMKIIQTMFQERWEESSELKLLVVFDEVHRLLEKYGGKGGYIALEKACREFRKWGIGLIMASQVSADFKEAVQGNILTEIQMNTKSIEDINHAKDKYGEEYSNRIAREGIGVGMIQNPKYNKGKPWFVQFRPPMHSPHKLTEEELNLYTTYSTSIARIEAFIEKMGPDNTDLMLEVKLAKDKLKDGHFKIVEVYLETINNKLLY